MTCGQEQFCGTGATCWVCSDDAISFELSVEMAEALTSNQRLHWAVKGKRSAALRLAAKEAAAKAADGRSLDRAHLLVAVGFPDSRRRDVANWWPTVKPCVDGVVDAGLLPDDDNTRLIGPDLRAHVLDRRGPMTLTFHFTPLENA